MNIINKRIELADGRVIEIETGKLAKQAAGSAVVKMGGTMLLATVTAAEEVKEGTDFMPLTVDYKEKYYSAGRFPGGFMKREGKSSDYEILISRLIDRPIRPLWPDDFHLEVFVNVTLISAEKDIQPDALAGLAASCALATSDLPFGGPISEVRVCRIGGEFVINPNFSQMPDADIDLMVAATEENIMMVEGEMNEVSEHDMLEAIKFAHEEIKKHCRVQKELMHELGTDVNKRDYPHDVEDEELKKAVHDFCYDKCYALAKSAKPKKEREQGFKAIKEEFLATIPEEELEEKTPLVERYYHHEEKEAMRNMILDEGVRLDGRKCNEVRPIWCEVDYLPCAHGSAIFTRGETQSLATVTLGTKMDMKETDEVLIQDDQQFVLHYNFPPFATGEARPQRGVGRREIGHGNHAQAVTASELLQLGSAHHGAVLPHDFAAQAAFLQPGDAHQVDGGLRMACAHQHTPFPRLEGKHVAGAAEIGRLGVVLHGFHGRDGALKGGDARGGRHVVDGDGERRAVVVGVRRHHLLQSQLVRHRLAHRHANQSFGVGSHDIHVFQRGVLGGAYQVALGLAVGVVDGYNHLARLQILHRFFYRTKFKLVHISFVVYVSLSIKNRWPAGSRASIRPTGAQGHPRPHGDAGVSPHTSQARRSPD